MQSVIQANSPMIVLLVRALPAPGAGHHPARDARSELESKWHLRITRSQELVFVVDVLAAEGERIERERFVLRHPSQSEMVDKGLLHKV